MNRRPDITLCKDPGPRLLSVILNYRTAEMTLHAAEAALQAMEGIAGGLVIVDNASGDGSFEKISAEAGRRGWTRGGRVRVIAAPHNGGYGAGNNLGIRAGLPDGTQPDYIYLLNPDAFPDPDAIRKLLDAMQADPALGLTGSYIRGADDRPHRTAYRFHSIVSEFEGAARLRPISWMLARHKVAPRVPSAPCRVDWVQGASLMIRARALHDTGLFDENFFLYYEETDLCRRAQAAGWAVGYRPESRVEHIGSVSTGINTRTQRIPGYWLDSRHYYFLRNHGRAYAAAATMAHIAGGLLWRLRMVLTGRRRRDPPRLLLDMAAHWLRHGLRRPPPPRIPAFPGPRGSGAFAPPARPAPATRRKT
ncbi:glycosyltransferase family 2 protein [Alkalilacustris brevis]|uniref:glycosyltransferase family 2 protein n=1 Tax=Alkalilacustris brevis TaxID=2026338 RepID=UPI000E0D95CF|nr:glycosyltransferase family 2 protein [Alkalilacustris brevis]